MEEVEILSKGNKYTPTKTLHGEGLQFVLVLLGNCHGYDGHGETIKAVVYSMRFIITTCSIHVLQAKDCITIQLCFITTNTIVHIVNNNLAIKYYL